jgi:hypothetical protein
MIYTSKFQHKGISNKIYIPVRISRGSPRFKIPYQIEATIPSLMPTYEMWRKGYSGAQYWDLLDARYDEIMTSIEAIRKGQKRSLVMLCFCDVPLIVVPGGKWCHRQIFADWWKKNTGEEVKEL